MRGLTLLVLVLAGAVAVGVGICVWQDDDDDDDARARDDGGLPQGDEGELTFEPDSVRTSGLILSITSADDEDVDFPGFIDTKGSLRLKVENVSNPSLIAAQDIPVSATAEDGRACQVLSEAGGFVAPQPGQYSEYGIRWDCEDLATLEIMGEEFRLAD
jgi:hypothetical protein